jgi:tight adherence protein B
MVSPVLAVFIVTLVVVLGVYWLLLERPEASERDKLRRRLKNVSVTAAVSAGGAALVRAEERLSNVPALDRLLKVFANFVEPVRLTIELSGLRVSVGAIVLSMAVCGAVAYLLVDRFLGVAWLAMFAAVFAMWIPWWYIRWAAKSRMEKFEEQFPEAIDHIARALRAGHALTTGLAMVGEEAPQPVAGEFKRLYDMQNFGMPLQEAMREFARRIPILDAKFFVTAVLTQRESGGNLAEVLDNLSSVIRDRFKVKRQVKVITAHARMSAVVLICLPPFLAVTIMFINPGHLAAMFSDPLGHYMLGGAAVLQVLGTLVIRKLVRLEY